MAKNYSFNTPASICAYVEAIIDRKRYFKGEASEMHISEPSDDEEATVPAARIPTPCKPEV